MTLDQRASRGVVGRGVVGRGGRLAFALTALVAASLSASCAERRSGPQGSPLPMHPDALLAMASLPPVADVAAGGAAPLGMGRIPSVEGSAPFPITPFTDAAANYRVEPGTQFGSLADVAPILKPGDVVDVVGDATYMGGVRFSQHGTAKDKIVIRGVARNGKRPVLLGGQNTIEAAGNHYVFENLDITGGSRRCFFHHANDITIRNSFVHDCPEQGILGADSDSGSLTIEYCEVARSGSGIYNHQLYIATDETRFPGSVFRLIHSYVHDATGGNNVKSRAERNEILYNWIEGAQYHELEMIGPDGQDPKLAREDGQVVGNVFYKANEFHAVRIGGDGTGATGGRYRFVNNTFVMAGDLGAIRLFDSLESVELYNNVFYRTGGQGVVLFTDVDAKWTTGRYVISGSHNWLSDGSVYPSSLSNTKTGGSAVFASLASRDLRPQKPGVLVGAGTSTTPTHAAFPLAQPLGQPAFEPPQAKVVAAKVRQGKDRPSVGAFEP